VLGLIKSTGDWSEPRKHDRKRHRAATANKLVDIVVVAAVVAAVALAAAVSSFSP
tara:strand:- start:75 stop:239 length:165 start_codon:yes stop_codon:yes gene_type:complete